MTSPLMEGFRKTLKPEVGAINLESCGSSGSSASLDPIDINSKSNKDRQAGHQKCHPPGIDHLNVGNPEKTQNQIEPIVGQ